MSADADRIKQLTAEVQRLEAENGLLAIASMRAHGVLCSAQYPERSKDEANAKDEIRKALSDGAALQYLQKLEHEAITHASRQLTAELAEAKATSLEFAERAHNAQKQRVEELQRQLQEARKGSANHEQTCDSIGAILDEERAAHERTKALLELERTALLVLCDPESAPALERVRLFQARAKLNDLRRRCLVELFDRGYIDEVHEDGCPHDDTCKCTLVPLLNAAGNSDDLVDVAAAETALAWCAQHSDVCTPSDCVCGPAKEDA